MAAVALSAGILLGMTKPDYAGAATVGKPITANPVQLKEGASLFRANCSACHGPKAQGGARGPALTSGRWVHGASDAAIFRTISQGVPGTEMPANNFEDSETRAMIAYLRSLGPSSEPGMAGDRSRGQQIFRGKGACSECHMVSGKGGRLGPDLTRVGAARSATYLIESIRDPDKELSDGMVDPNNRYVNALIYDTVNIVTSTGQHITGIAKNEDTFSIQLLDTEQHLHLLLKTNLASVTHGRGSLMPAYTREALSDTELRDLVVYLVSLRGDQ